jgi:hypothetical protein
MFGIPETLARQRFDSLNSVLQETKLPNVRGPVTITVSHGLSLFNTISDIHRAIDNADEGMYRLKATKRQKATRAAFN